MPEVESWTIGRLLTWTTEYLREQGSDSARLDAELLLAQARECQRIELYTAFSQEAPESVRTKFRTLVGQRAKGVPVAYLLGRKEFFSLSFRVTPAVLIPRPETEFVVLEMLDRVAEIAQQGGPIRMADVGTGSGILAICGAKKMTGATVTAIDICGEALDVARANAKEHGVESRIQFIEGDLLLGLPTDELFDLIVSNPPYLSEKEIEEVSVDVRDHEPRSALVSGPTGLEIYERLIPQAAERLVSGGWLLLEISPQLEEEVLRLVGKEPCFHLGKTVKDLSRHARVIAAQKR